MRILDPYGRPATRRGSVYAPGGYTGAGWSRSRSHISHQPGDSFRQYTPFARGELARKCDFFVRNFGMVRGVRESIVNYAVGPGIYPLPATSSDEWNARAFAWFSQLAQIGDVSERMTLWEAQAQRTRAKFSVGEMFTAHVRRADGWPQFQLIRAHNVGDFDVASDAGWSDGVKLSASGAPTAYRVRLAAYAGGADRSITLPARSVVHSYLLEDADQVRGVPACAHAVNELHDMRDVLDIEFKAIKDNSAISRVVTTQSGELEGADDPFVDPTLTPAEQSVALKLADVLGPEIKYLKTGEKLESFVSERPSATFTGFIDWQGKLVSNGCGFPYEFSWDPGSLKGPGARLVLEKVRLAIGHWRQNEVQDTYPFYTFAISCAMELGELPFNPEWAKVEWIGGAEDPTIDKARDAAQDRENIRAALDTFKAYYARRGLWWKTQLTQRAEEAGYLEELAKKYGTTVERIQAFGATGSAPAQQQATEQQQPAPAEDDE